MSHRHAVLRLALFGWLATCGAASASAAQASLDKGFVGMETYFYPQEGAPGQNESVSAMMSQVELHLTMGKNWSSTVTPFLRLDAVDSHRSLFDFREAELNYADGPWRYALGMRRLSWSVTESVNIVPHQLVDIMNQRDLAGHPAGQEKMGAAMGMVSWQGDSTLVQAFVLPWFRPRRFGSTEAREHPFRGTIDLNDNIDYTSAADRYRLNAALRVERSFDSADLALIQYQGYAPQPLISPDFSTGKSSQLYYLIDMSAFTLQATAGKWLFKSETAYFNTDLNPDRFTAIPDNYWATVSGIEYTFVRAFGDSDLGVIAEWMYDSRGLAPNSTPFQEDVFVGLRWVANDQADSTFLGGVAMDLEQRANIFQMQFQRRFGTHVELQIVGRAFSAEARNPLNALSDDTMLLGRLRYFF
jgi:hypothetical protein